MKDFQLSKTDKEIISMLRLDSRISYKEIASKTGVAISTVHNTVKRLIDSGIIKNFSVKLDSEKLGFDVTVIIGLMAKHGSLIELQNRLIEHPNVCQSFIVTGEYDIIIVAKFKSTNELNIFIRNFLQKIEGVERTNTSLVLDTLKERLNPSFDELRTKP